MSKLRGEYVAPSLGKVTVGELGPAWLERQRGHMKPSGFRSYDSAWRVHVAPRWARTSASRSIRYTDVQAWVPSCRRALSASMVATVYSVLARILDDAVRDRSLAVQPGAWCEAAQAPPRHNVYLTASQLDRLARRRPGRYRSLVLLLGVGGLRWGEAAALRVSDVDFLRRRIGLHRNAVTSGQRGRRSAR